MSVDVLLSQHRKMIIVTITEEEFFGRNPRIKNDNMGGWMSDGSSIGEPEVTEGAGSSPVSRPNFNEKA